MSTITPITSFWVCHLGHIGGEVVQAERLGRDDSLDDQRCSGREGGGGQLGGAVKSYETSLFAEVHDLGDDFATAADDFVDNVLGDWLPYAQSVASAVAGAAHGGVSALDTLLSSLRTAGTTQAQDDRASWTSYKLGIVGNEDGLMSGVPPIVGPGVMRV